MLISEKLVKEWYKKNSLVYKNFAYIFRNPLWKKSVPNGFSVCPYFWLSMIVGTFMFCAFVPGVMFVKKLFVIPFIQPIDKLCFKIGCWIFNSEDEYTPGPGLFVISMFLGVLSLIALLTIGLGGMWISGGEPLAPYFFSAFSITALFIICGLVERYRYFKLGACKVGIYYYVWGIVSLIAGFFIVGPVDCLAGLAIVGGGIADIAIWFWAIIATCASFIGKIIYFFLFFSIAGGLSIAAIMAITAAILFPIGWLIQKKMHDKEEEEIEAEPPDPEEYWFSYIATCLAPRVKTKLRAFSLKETRYPLEVESHSLGIRAAVKAAYKTVCIVNQIHAADGRRLLFQTFKNKSLDMSFGVFGKFFIDVPVDEQNSTMDNIYDEKYSNPVSIFVVEEAFKQMLMDKYITDQLNANKKKYEQNKLKFDKRDNLCQKLTDVFNTMMKPLEMLFRGIYKSVVAIFTFFSYLLILAVSKKKKACPFFYFQDVEKNKKEDKNYD
jgi:hypothetical protein